MDDKVLGHLRHIVNLSRQLPGDWSDMGPYDPGQEGDDAYRYQLAYMAYTLALTQYHHTPAYRELWRKTFRDLIEKMLRWDVWAYWELTSRGSKLFDPELEKLGEGWVDPVIKQNVMYSGHLLMMVSLYEMLYRDGTYDAEGSLVFKFRPTFRGMGPVDYSYNHQKLLKAIHDEFARNDFLGCECEPNGIFVYCNQFPLLGFKHYDHTHGTDYFSKTMPSFVESWKKKSSMFKMESGLSLPIFYMKRQDEFVYEESEENQEGITAVAWASIMHAWAKDYVELVYPEARDQVILRKEDGTLKVNLKGYFEKYKKYKDCSIEDLQGLTDPMMVGVHIFGTLALAAAEVGDSSTLQGMLAYADKYMAPQWKNGGYFYPRNDDLGGDGYTTNLVGNALLAAARACPKDGFWQLYNNPWTESDINLPEVCGVDYPRIQVREAKYADGGKSLEIGLVCADGKCTTSFVVNKIKASKVSVTLSMGIRAELSLKTPTFQSSQVSAHYDSKEGALELSVSFDAKLALRVEMVS